MRAKVTFPLCSVPMREGKAEVGMDGRPRLLGSRFADDIFICARACGNG